jgi:hypothetical protein
MTGDRKGKSVAHECELSRRDSGRLDLQGHRRLHEQGQKLIDSWFEKAWSQRDSADVIFESFIFAWFSVNAWAACVTEMDRDLDYVQCLSGNAEMNSIFDRLMREDRTCADAANRFHGLWPIFKAQSIRKKGLWPKEGMSRHDLIQFYLKEGIETFEPACAVAHTKLGEQIPLDWPHTFAAIYRVRNNLFHGEKAAHSEMDQTIVKAAFDALILFFRGAGIL